MKNDYLGVFNENYSYDNRILIKSSKTFMTEIIYDRETVSLGTYKGKPLDITVSAHRMDHGPYIEYTIEASCPYEKNVVLSANDGIHPFSLLEDNDFDDDNYNETGGIVADNEFTRTTLKSICKINETNWGNTAPQYTVRVLIKTLIDLWD